ncbi:tRNA pseudouridine(55) synthase TruB [Alkalithermobacter paradoxus]|uniref:tRNA pseudouridine synthase B n=1 Tax=Alkalithermobacter paradoxus TaxID=29349 RepID=A0A1V4IC91_9FIRM|nr:tRNA pseudouridine synthase B [[Clostridium] thermoalcaliphilum]
MNGIINILKPTGMTSHDVVHNVRKIMSIKKVGHTGTLDPNAAGVLPICIGKGTKIADLLLNKEKSYRAELTLGVETDTYDSFGSVVQRKKVKGISDIDIIKAFEKFKGEIYQTPPVYSAIKMNGKKLYELARQGKTDIDIKSRKVFIKHLEILSIKNNKILFDLTCSKGTYVRSICKDIGDELGCGGHMSFLLRTSSGPFKITNSITLEELQEYKDKDQGKYLFDVDFCLDEYKSIHIKESALKSFLNGAYVSKKGLIDVEESTYTKEELVRVYCNGKFYGIGKIAEVDNMLLRNFKLFI